MEHTEKICEAILKHFSKRACWFQIKVAEALYANKDVVGIAPTGSGKTLAFFGGPVMAMEEDPAGEHMVIIASPLSLLSKQNVEMLLVANTSAIALTAENNNEKTFQVRSYWPAVLLLHSAILWQPLLTPDSLVSPRLSWFLIVCLNTLHDTDVHFSTRYICSVARGALMVQHLNKGAQAELGL